MSNQIPLFELEPTTDPDVIVKVGMTSQFNVDNRFKNHVLKNDYYIYTEFSDLFLAAEAHQIENEWHQKYSSSIYNVKLTLAETTAIDGISEMRAMAAPIRYKVMGEFKKLRAARGWIAQTQALKKKYYMDSDGSWNESLNINTDPNAEHPFYCYKIYVVYFAKKGTVAGEEIRERKEKALKERKELQAAK